MKLIDVCDFQGGSQPPKDEWSFEAKDGYIRMLQIRDFTQGEKVIPEYIKLSANTKTCQADDVLIARYGASLGKILTGLSGAYNVAIMRTIPNEEFIRKRYLYYFLKSNAFQKGILEVGARAAQAGFNKDDLSKLEIPCPSLSDQDQIIGRLNTISRIIDFRMMQLDCLDQLTEARFFELFGNPVLNEKEWTTKPLLEMGTCKNGMNFHNDDSGVEINCLGVGDFKNHSVIENTELLPKVSLNEMPSNDYLLKDDDIVFVRSNGNKALVGRSVAVYPGAIPTTFSGFCIRYRKHDDVVTIPYLLRVLKTDSMRKKMAGRGANIHNLNQQILSNLVIPVPPIELQIQFDHFVKKVDKSKAVVQKALDETQVLFESLMQKYYG